MSNILEYKGYYTKIKFDADDKILFGKIDGIDDLVNFQSDSLKSIEKEFHDAVDDYLRFCEEVGKEPEKTYKGSFNIRITPEFHKKAATAAYKLGITLNSFVELAIGKALKGQE